MATPLEVRSPDPSPRSEGLWTTWDSKTQAFHAGQEWQELPNFQEDFSLDTNALGVPESGLKACQQVIHDIHHYPPADFEPCLTHLAKFLWPEEDEWEDNKRRLLMGNGCSELIDLIVRCGTLRGGFKPGPHKTQYKEFERSAKANGFKVLPPDDMTATLTGLCNPNVPTGDYLPLEKLKEYIEARCPNGSTVIVDETNQLWLGPHWRQESLVSQKQWILQMSRLKGIRIYILHSWSKFFTCPGIRVGSCVAPTTDTYEMVKAHQVPWTVNCLGLAFLQAAVQDDDYARRTWQAYPPLRERMKNYIEAVFKWKVHGESWVPFLWIDTGDPDLTHEIVTTCRSQGVPVRSGRLGYNCPTFFRVAIRLPDRQDLLFQALQPFRPQVNVP